jgi:hypothetical protein
VQELIASNGEASSVLSYNVEKRIYLAFTFVIERLRIDGLAERPNSPSLGTILGFLLT